MSYFNQPANDFYETFQSRDEEIADYEERRDQAQSSRYWLSVEQSDVEPFTTFATQAEMDSAFGVTADYEAMLVDAGCSPQEAEAVRKPVKVARMQGELFPEVA